MRAWLEKVMGYHGQTCTVEKSDGSWQNSRGFLRSALDTSLQNLQLDMDVLGKNPQSKYICTLPCSCGLDMTCRLCCEGIWYLPRSVEIITWGREQTHIWALLVREGTLDETDS